MAPWSAAASTAPRTESARGGSIRPLTFTTWTEAGRTSPAAEAGLAPSSVKAERPSRGGATRRAFTGRDCTGRLRGGSPRVPRRELGRAVRGRRAARLGQGRHGEDHRGRGAGRGGHLRRPPGAARGGGGPGPDRRGARR